MVEPGFEDEKTAEIVGFDDDGNIIWVVSRDGEKRTKPTGGFEEGPVKNIDLVKTNVVDVLIWDQRDEAGQISARKRCYHQWCQIWC